MLHKPAGIAPVVAPFAAGGAYAVMPPGDGDDIVAWRANRPVSRAAFLGDVAALAARLPDYRYVLNLCTDRYRFMTGFAAALSRQQISLLPPSDAPGVLQAVAADYPDVYALTDGTQVKFASLRYPDDLDHGGCGANVPAILENQAALILFTSGSTGRPQPVPNPGGSSSAVPWRPANGWEFPSCAAPASSALCRISIVMVWNRSFCGPSARPSG